MTSAPLLYPDVAELAPRFGDRGLFPDLQPLVYCNHAGISPPSLLVKKAVNALVSDYGKWGAQAYPRWAAQRARLRAKLATVIHAEPDEIAFTQNTSRSVGDIAMCFPWKEGDRVVLFNGEFPANVTPWRQAAETFGLDVVMLDGDEFRTNRDRAFARLEEALSHGRPRLCAISAVAFQTGFRLPLREVSDRCHRRDAWLFVDAVQACGMTPIDVRAEGIDFLGCGAHKWLMGMEGAGFLYASRERAAMLSPRVASWLSHEEPVDFLLEGPDRLRYDKPIRATIDFIEGGNVAAACFAALEGSLDAILRLSIDAIHAHANRFNDVLEEKALELGFTSLRSSSSEERSGTLSLLPPEGVDVVALQRDLTNAGIAAAIPDGKLRFSPHWPNAVDEVDQIALTLAEILKGTGPRESDAQ